MNTGLTPIVVASWLFVGCAGGYSIPAQQLADSEAAERSAVELGAGSEPNAQLHLQLAHEQLAQAKVAARDGDEARANGLLLRSRADAELAVALTREQTAKAEAAKAAEQSSAQQVTNSKQGAQ